MRLSLTPLIVLLLFTCAAHSYKILVYIPKFAVSHINFMGKIADTLVEAGHNVTALISEMDASLPDGTKKVQNIIRISPGEGANHMNEQYSGQDNSVDMFDFDFESYSGFIENAYHNSISFCIQCRKLLTTPGLVEQLKNEKYDALITESFENCGTGLSHLISPNAFIPVSSFPSWFDTAPFGLHYSITTEHFALFDGRYHNTLHSRLMTIFLTYAGRKFLATQDEPLHQVFEELYPGTPSFSTLLSHSAVAFSNQEPLLDYARPIISKMIPIGGINVPSPKPLNNYWDGILSLRPKTVLVSFGSIAKSGNMIPARKAALLKAFASFPDTTFIWKYEKEDEFAKNDASKVANVVLTDWMPQMDILADPRLTLFISHAGVASCHESAHFGVPSLLIPIFGDQTSNAGILAHVGIAQVFSKADMKSSEKIRTAIAEMLGTSKYKKEARLLQEKLAARPTSPVERLVKNVEFSARFGPSKALRPLNFELSTVQLWGIDLAAIAIGLLAVASLCMTYVYKLARKLLAIVHLKKSKLE